MSEGLLYYAYLEARLANRERRAAEMERLIAGCQALDSRRANEALALIERLDAALTMLNTRIGAYERL